MQITKILAVLPLYHKEEETLDCLKAFSETNLEGLGLSVVLAVNGASETFLDKLKGIQTGDLPGIPNGASAHMLQLPNPGKGVAVNTAVSIYAQHPDFILSLDSDMVPVSPLWLRILTDSYQRLVLDPSCRLGALATQQVGMCCHVPVEPRFHTYKEFSYTFARHNQGIAGGCILTPYSVWCELGGYKAHRVYGSDDAFYMQDLHEAGYEAAIAENCVLYHPSNTDPCYADWKRRACQDKLTEKEMKGYFE